MRKRLASIFPLTWYAFFLIVPLSLVVVLSFLKRGEYGGIDWVFSLDNFYRLGDALYFRIFAWSVLLALTNASLCVVMGLPIAYLICLSRYKKLLLILIVLPSLACLLVRVYSIKVMFGFEGPIIAFLHRLNWQIDPFMLTHNWYLVLLGMVVVYLPFVILPMHSTLEKFDFSLMDAAMDLGAGFYRAFTIVLLPNVLTTLRRTWWLIFVPSLGEFVIPDLLGGARIQLVGNLITEQFLRARDWPMGAAITVFFILVVGLIGRWVNKKAVLT